MSRDFSANSHAPRDNRSQRVTSYGTPIGRNAAAISGHSRVTKEYVPARERDIPTSTCLGIPTFRNEYTAARVRSNISRNATNYCRFFNFSNRSPIFTSCARLFRTTLRRFFRSALAQLALAKNIIKWIIPIDFITFTFSFPRR